MSRPRLSFASIGALLASAGGPGAPADQAASIGFSLVLLRSWS